METVEVRPCTTSEVKKPDSCRFRCSKAMKPKALPRTSLVPDLVTTLTTPPAERPNSGAKELVTTWNSCTASCETVLREALTELSVLSAPSTCTRFERPRCPPKLRPEVGAGPMGRVLSRETVEVVRVKLM